MDLGLKGKVALVAAASDGLGKASALALAREGARVAICGRRKEMVDDAAADIRRQTGADLLAVQADVAQAADVTRFVEETRKKFGTVHVLVNNAGGPPTGDILTLSDDDWERGFRLTMMSTVRLTRAVLPMMMAQRWGRVVTITSFVARQPLNELILSAAMRPGIHALTKILSNLHAPQNITVNAVAPGNILTKRQENLNAERAKKKGVPLDQYWAEVAKEIPSARFGRPEEVGNVVAFLASEQASYINGVSLLVDGGLTKAAP
ncbi:MAG TPA: SDR family oxidoreductase [Bacteroidota bacterium]|nr:SDR family oxidoreductase [Bacteroidota bacterium]